MSHVLIFSQCYILSQILSYKHVVVHLFFYVSWYLQVSNWFINARVRLWKPLIEEMYAEMNRRMLCQNENIECNYRSTNNPREI